MSGAQDNYLDGVIARLQDQNMKLKAWAENEQRLRHKAEEDRMRLRSALEKAEEADQFHIKCPDCDGEELPEQCGTCFPLADDARLMRWAALGIRQPMDDAECTCRMSSVNSATIDPPEPILDRECPVHGSPRDPDAEYEAKRDDKDMPWNE